MASRGGQEAAEGKSQVMKQAGPKLKTREPYFTDNILLKDKHTICSGRVIITI